ncbi:VOC family protein [Neisseriaceae bacterium JH1-16]|nr:VOC family protein [Neisseriaceae bacterium JH1-16]
MQVQPYLFFAGRCDEAIAFYQQALGAKVEMLMRFKDSPEPPPPGQLPPGFEDKVMHASLRIGDSIVMASDGSTPGEERFQGVSLSLSPATLAEAEQRFTALADGGEVRMQLTPTFFSPGFGMVSDRFGLTWMVMVAAS